jgi:hypothetical protein
MSKRQLIILFGALIIIIALFSWLPPAWNTALYVIIGLLNIAVAYTTGKPAQSQTKKVTSAPYVDNKPSVSPAPSTPSPDTTTDSNSQPQA